MSNGQAPVTILGKDFILPWRQVEVVKAIQAGFTTQEEIRDRVFGEFFDEGIVRVRIYQLRQTLVQYGLEIINHEGRYEIGEITMSRKLRITLPARTIELDPDQVKLIGVSGSEGHVRELLINAEPIIQRAGLPPGTKVKGELVDENGAVLGTGELELK